MDCIYVQLSWPAVSIKYGDYKMCYTYALIIIFFRIEFGNISNDYQYFHLEPMNKNSSRVSFTYFCLANN